MILDSGLLFGPPCMSAGWPAQINSQRLNRLMPVYQHRRYSLHLATLGRTTFQKPEVA